MASRIRVKLNRSGIRSLLNSDEALEVVAEKAEAIAAACNAQSSWGGYFAAASADGVRARAKVWSADRRNDEGRDQRLVKNMDAGS